MRRFLMMTAIAATTLGAAQSALADIRPEDPPPACQRDRKDCPKPPQGERGKRPDRDMRSGDDRRGPPPQEGRQDRDEARHAPHDGARRGPPPPDGQSRHPGERDGHMAKAPRGQDYRVIDDQLVLVDKKSGKVVKVIGPAPR